MGDDVSGAVHPAAARNINYREVPDDGSAMSSDDEAAEAAARDRRARELRLRLSDYPLSPTESEDESYEG